MTPDDVLVLRNAGPKGAPGMPEAGYIPIPRKLAAQGVTDMVRLSDARMSGTAFGTIVLHACPEAAVGGPLALVETGDSITLDRGGARAHAGRAAGDPRCAPGGVAPPRRPRRAPSAATWRCTSPMWSRPIAAATWIFSPPRAPAPRCRSERGHAAGLSRR